MLGYIQSYLVTFLEVLCCKIYFEIFCRNRRKIKFLHQTLFWVFLCSLLFSFAVFLDDFFILKEICIINILALMAGRYWGLTYSRSYILTVIFQSMILVVDYVTVIIYQSILPEIDSQNDMGQFLVSLLAKAFLFLFIVFIKTLFLHQQLEYLEDIGWLKFLFFPLFSICIITALISNIDFIENKMHEQLFWVLAFGMVGMNIFLFYFIQDTVERERMMQEKRIFEIEADNNMKLYESLSVSIEKQRKISHEYQNQLACIQLLLQKKEYQKLKEYMEQITGKILQNLDYIDTNHVIVNAILNEKYRQALEKNIVMVCKISDLSSLHIEEQDVALLLSNLLNNAIEACQKCKEKKIIKLKIVLENENIIISVQNTYDGNINFSSGEYLTTKEQNVANHGMGIKNVLQVIHKYGGFYSIRHTEREFYFSIIIPQETCR